MNSQDSRQESRGVFIEFQGQVRRLLLDAPRFRNRVKQELEKQESRELLRRWLELQRENLADDERWSPRFVAQLNAIDYPAKAKAPKREFIDNLIRQLKANGTDCDALVNQLVTAGLGVAFMRYSDAMRLSYYHTLESDLLPDETRKTIQDTAIVPDWSGTIGWISRETFQNRPKKKDPRSDWTALWSCFNDPKGRVATEDLILGNRSFAATPVLELDPDTDQFRLLGIAFCFFPLEGVFMDEKDRSLLQCVRERLRVEWDLRREELLYALRLEAVETLYRVSRRSALADVGRSYARGDDAGEDDQSRRLRWLTTTLMSKGEKDPSDPLGFQLVVDAEQNRSIGRDSLSADCKVLFREETFVRELFDRLQMSCRCPTRWAPGYVWDMQAIHDAMSVGAARPVWRSDASANVDACNCHSAVGQLYPGDAVGDYSDGFQVDDNHHASPALSKLTERRALIQTIYQNMDDAEDELQPSLPESEFDKQDPFRLRHVLRHFSPPDRIVDLVVPLVFDSKCVGLIRLKCWADHSLRDKLPSESLAQFHRLHGLFCEEFSNVHDGISRLLWDFEHQCDHARDDMPRLKTWLDIRLAFCDAIAKGICRGVGRSDESNGSFKEQFELVATAATIEGLAAKAKDSREPVGESEARGKGYLSGAVVDEFGKRIDECQKSLKAFVRKARDCAIPDVALVSVWLTRERPTIIGAGKEVVRNAASKKGNAWVEDCLNNNLHDVLIDDRASMQFLRLFLRWSRQHDHVTIDYVRKPDSTKYAIDVSSHADDSAQPPSDIETPPVYLATRETNDGKRTITGFTECECLQFRTRKVELQGGKVDVSHTVFRRERDDSVGLRIDWCWKRSPIPVAVDYVPSLVNKALFRSDDDRGAHRVQFTVKANDLFDSMAQSEEHDLHKFDDIFEVEESEDQDASGIPRLSERVHDILSFLPNEQHDASRLCRLRCTVVDERRYVILAYGQIPKKEKGGERAHVRQLRDDAMTGAIGDVALLMQTSAVKFAREHNNHIRFIAHELVNDFGTTDGWLANMVHSASRGRLAETAERSRIVQLHYKNLRCLTRCLTRSLDNVAEFRMDVIELLKTVTEWKLGGIEKSFTVDISGIDEHSNRDLRLPVKVMRDILLIYNNLLRNAVDAAQHAPPATLRLSAALSTESENLFEVRIGNSATEPIAPVFKRFVESCDERLHITLPLKPTGKRHLGLWTVRHLLSRNKFPRARVVCRKENGDLIGISEAGDQWTNWSVDDRRCFVEFVVGFWIGRPKT